MHWRDYEKNKMNAISLSLLSLGSRVEVIKTGEFGIVTKIIKYNREKYNSSFGYSTVQVKFDNYNYLPHHKKVRHYSASSLKIIDR